MPDDSVITQHTPAIAEVHILWLTQGRVVTVTRSRSPRLQPSIEDVILGAIPGLPKVQLHIPVLAYEVGDDFMAPYHQAARGELGNCKGQPAGRRARTLSCKI